MKIEKISDCKESSKKQQDVEDQLKKVSDQHKNLNTQPVESYTMAFNPSKEPCVQLGHLSDLTAEVHLMPKYAFVNKEVKIHILSKDGKGQNYPRGGSKVVVELQSSIGGITVGKIFDNNDGSYVASLVPEQVGDAKIVVSINGEQIKERSYSIVVARNYQAIDKPSKIVNINGSMGQPWGVAFGRNGLWAVADWRKDCVYMFDGKDQLVRKFGSNGSNNGQFKFPCGVAFDSHNHLYVVDNGNHRVQKFDTNGNYLLQFGSEGASHGQLDRPYGITVHDDKVYIADWRNKRISVFQTNGKICISFRSDIS